MSQSGGIMTIFRKAFGGGSSAPQPRMKVMNTTRQTVLATNLKVADTGRARNKGLLGRNGLSEGEGLWIIPCEAVHTFGMKFPIDLVYLDSKLSVRKVKSAVPATRISVCLSARSVIELPAGVIHATGTRIGDMIEFIPVHLIEIPQTNAVINV